MVSSTHISYNLVDSIMNQYIFSDINYTLCHSFLYCNLRTK